MPIAVDWDVKDQTKQTHKGRYQHRPAHDTVMKKNITPLATWQQEQIEPRHEISNNVVCTTSKGSDQPAHTRSLIRAFASSKNILWVLSYWLNRMWSF